eukprot:SAG22_NODE_416_length_10804_cov_4.791126_2_plen_327_part_00
MLARRSLLRLAGNSALPAPATAAPAALLCRQLSAAQQAATAAATALAPLRFSIGGGSRPHPAKGKIGLPGEDAFFWTFQQDGAIGQPNVGTAVIGVADGTSAAEGGIYSATLMGEAEAWVLANGAAATAEAAPAQILTEAWTEAGHRPIEGRSTACIVKVCSSSDVCSAAVLGDSGLLLLRPAAEEAGGGYTVPFSMHEHVDEQQHYFNCPYQLGTLGGAESNTPADALLVEFEIAAGDILVVSTDGLFDVLWPADVAEIVRLVRTAAPRGATAQKLAEKLVELAQQWAQDSRRETPFGARAKEEGLISRPGEVMDDAAIVVCMVT